MEDTLFDQVCAGTDGKTLSMGKYRGCVCLVVNVASRCGLTEVNYTQLGELDAKFKAHGLRVLGFPSNQFANQEPGTSQEIQAVATSFGASFPLFAKADVAGPSAQPVFAFLGQRLGAPKWNFTKYLIGRDGHPFQVYGPKTTPHELEHDIVSLLGSKL